MKCTKCNVELADIHTTCPLCGCHGVHAPSRFSCTSTPYPPRATIVVKKARRFLRKATV